jgi:Protein of unknown function (DUF1552)
MTRTLSRRRMLKGVGTALALPWLEAMGPMVSWADSPARRTPNRLAFFYVPNGINMQHWTPAGDGAIAKLPNILAPLKAVQDDVLVLTGLTADKARPNGDGPGDHARAMAAFLTGCQPRKTDGADIRAGVSVDQVAASRIGDQTRLSSLEIGCDASQMAGNCDSGYSCVYSSTISWRSPTTPVPKLNNPRQIFDRLFGSDSGADRARRERQRRSILDYVRADSASLQSRLGASDRRKLEEYFTAIRDVEQRIERAARLPQPPMPNLQVPADPPAYHEQIRLLCDLLVLAFQTDSTRVATFVFANEGSNRAYSFIGVPDGHHDLSHHGNDAVKLNKIRQINTFHMTQYAYLLGKLKSIREGDGTLLDHCMLVYGSGNSDGNRHNHDDLPILLAGKGCGNIRTGRHVRYRRDTPLNNLWLALLARMNCNIERLGDSTGTLTGLA